MIIKIEKNGVTKNHTMTCIQCLTAGAKPIEYEIDEKTGNATRIRYKCECGSVFTMEMG